MNQDDSEAKSGGRAIWTNKFGVHKYIRQLEQIFLAPCSNASSKQIHLSTCKNAIAFVNL